MSIYSDKLSHIHVASNCQYSIAQMCTREDRLAPYLDRPYLDDVMSQNELTTNYCIILHAASKEPPEIERQFSSTPVEEFSMLNFAPCLMLLKFWRF